MNTRTLSSLVVASVLAYTGGVFAQQAPRLEFPAPSPAGSVKQRVGLTDIEITYSRPGMKGRKVFGSLVPYGEVWRTGANQATRVTFSTPVKFGGTDVPAGSYALYTIPEENEWTVILSKRMQDWAAVKEDTSEDVARVKVKPVNTSPVVETFTIDINDIRDESATLNLSWENTRVAVPIQIELKSKLVPQIEKAMSEPGGRKPYFQAAMFYFDHDIDLGKAREWVEESVKQNEAYYTVHLKAKILAKAGDKAGAEAAAKRSLELAQKARDAHYIRENEKLLATLK
ncbi:MAG TPA: DUF2911 domain-containing protein [Verrucomicrobia bacterium]|nr:DUF2911 domain-containing protein [Verrucomicrobiota bacterium]HOB33491.1 DUF2911 domain-containing protein [Verrucomicrobiota bacterium]HOP98554.1 DUF2911 domain-containing protein [Verrucomicrobiota bacterium]HPU57060.1 DUF2911 domain-containing protein [Verrucomicrobiota bacterium]